MTYMNDYRAERSWRGYPTFTVVMNNGDKFEVVNKSRFEFDNLWADGRRFPLESIMKVEYLVREEFSVAIYSADIDLTKISSIHGSLLERCPPEQESDLAKMLGS